MTRLLRMHLYHKDMENVYLCKACCKPKILIKNIVM